MKTFDAYVEWDLMSLRLATVHENRLLDVSPLFLISAVPKCEHPKTRAPKS